MGIKKIINENNFNNICRGWNVSFIRCATLFDNMYHGIFFNKRLNKMNKTKETHCDIMQEVANIIGCSLGNVKYHFCTMKREQRNIKGYSVRKSEAGGYYVTKINNDENI